LGGGYRIHSTSSNLMTGISDFVQQSHNFIASW
jgi:hypothetical protein